MIEQMFVRTNVARTNDARTNDARTNDARTNDVRTNVVGEMMLEQILEEIWIQPIYSICYKKFIQSRRSCNKFCSCLCIYFKTVVRQNVVGSNVLAPYFTPEAILFLSKP
jgi:hypothetical protein